MSHYQVRRTFPPAPSIPRALLLKAHPLEDSFNTALAKAWATGAENSGVEVRTLQVHDLDFNPALWVAHREDTPLEPDLVRVQTEIAEAAHLTLAFPVWWGSSPALLKGLFDRVLQPGWAYARGDGVFPEKGLCGRSARLLMTMDCPGWYDWLSYGASARRQIKTATFAFTGIGPTRVSNFSAIEKSTPESREKMLQKAQADGLADGLTIVRRFGRQVQQEPA